MDTKKDLCAYMCRQGLTVIPHNSPHCLVQEKIPCGLRLLGRGLRQCCVSLLIIVAYGMKAPFADMCLFSSFQPPPSSLLSRYDLGRYCYVLYIPAFRKQGDVSGTVYPMLGELGGSSGSVEVNSHLPNAQSCVLKCYPTTLSPGTLAWTCPLL